MNSTLSREDRARRSMEREARRAPSMISLSGSIEPKSWKEAAKAANESRLAIHEAAKSGDVDAFLAAQKAGQAASDRFSIEAHRFCPTPFVLEASAPVAAKRKRAPRPSRVTCFQIRAINSDGDCETVENGMIRTTDKSYHDFGHFSGRGAEARALDAVRAFGRKVLDERNSYLREDEGLFVALAVERFVLEDDEPCEHRYIAAFSLVPTPIKLEGLAYEVLA